MSHSKWKMNERSPKHLKRSRVGQVFGVKSNRMAKSFNRHFQFLGSSKNVQSGRLWLPAADVFQTADGWLVKVELAGVSAEDIDIDIQGKTLYIAGCRK